MNENEIKRLMSARWVQLVIGLILLLMLGLIYAWSVFRGPLMEDVGEGVKNTFTVTMIMFCIGGLIGGIINGRTTPRITMILCLIFVFIGVLGTSMAGSVGTVLVMYGVFYGLGVGFGYNTVISTVVKWFPDKTGLASGILLMGFGFGSFLLGMVANIFIVANGWRPTFRGLAILLGVIIAAGAVLIKPAPGDFVAHLTQGGGKARPPYEEANTATMLRRPNFWLVFLFAILVSAAGLIVINISKPFAEYCGIAATAAAGVAGIVSIFNGVGRVLFGALFDRLGFKIPMLLNAVFCVLAGIFVFLANGAQSAALMIVAFVVIGAAYGGAPTACSACCAGMFGRQHYAVNFPIMNLNLIVASIVGPMLVNGDSYTLGFTCIIIFGVISAVLALLLRKPGNAELSSPAQSGT